MRNSNRYVLGLSLMAALVVVSGVFFLNRLMGTSHQLMSDEVTYNMPRPKSALYNFFFGLEGREVRRNEINPFKDRNASTSTGAGSVRKPETAKEIAEKAAKAAKASQAAAQTANAKAQAQAQALAARKKSQVKVTVIPKDANKNSSSADGANRGEQTAALPGYVQPPTKSVSGGGGVEVQDNRMSPSQWRALVVGQPSKENVEKLIAAFNEKEVDSATLYLIMNDLVQSSNVESQGAGLTIAQQVPSLKSFTVVSTNYEKLEGSVKKNADSYFMSYMQSSRLPILAMALQSEDNALVHRAAQIMVVGLETAKTPVPSDSQIRPGRGAVAGTSTKSPYAQFIPLFQNLEKNPDSSISGLAQNALGRLQALSNT